MVSRTFCDALRKSKLGDLTIDRPASGLAELPGRSRSGLRSRKGLRSCSRANPSKPGENRRADARPGGVEGGFGKGGEAGNAGGVLIIGLNSCRGGGWNCCLGGGSGAANSGTAVGASC